MVPSPRMRIAPGAIPTVESTDGNERMPKEMVSAIITEKEWIRISLVDQRRSKLWDLLVLHCLKHSSVSTFGQFIEGISTYHHSNVRYLTSPSSTSPNGSVS